MSVVTEKEMAAAAQPFESDIKEFYVPLSCLTALRAAVALHNDASEPGWISSGRRCQQSCMCAFVSRPQSLFFFFCQRITGCTRQERRVKRTDEPR